MNYLYLTLAGFKMEIFLARFRKNFLATLLQKNYNLIVYSLMFLIISLNCSPTPFLKISLRALIGETAPLVVISSVNSSFSPSSFRFMLTNLTGEQLLSKTIISSASKKVFFIASFILSFSLFVFSGI